MEALARSRREPEREREREEPTDWKKFQSTDSEFGVVEPKMSGDGGGGNRTRVRSRTG